MFLSLYWVKFIGPNLFKMFVKRKIYIWINLKSSNQSLLKRHGCFTWFFYSHINTEQLNHICLTCKNKPQTCCDIQQWTSLEACSSSCGQIWMIHELIWMILWSLSLSEYFKSEFGVKRLSIEWQMSYLCSDNYIFYKIKIWMGFATAWGRVHFIFGAN